MAGDATMKRRVKAFAASVAITSPTCWTTGTKVVSRMGGAAPASPPRSPSPAHRPTSNREAPPDVKRMRNVPQLGMEDDEEARPVTRKSIARDVAIQQKEEVDGYSGRPLPLYNWSGRYEKDDPLAPDKNRQRVVPLVVSENFEKPRSTMVSVPGPGPEGPLELQRFYQAFVRSEQEHDADTNVSKLPQFVRDKSIKFRYGPLHSRDRVRDFKGNEQTLPVVGILPLDDVEVVSGIPETDRTASAGPGPKKPMELALVMQKQIDFAHSVTWAEDERDTILGHDVGYLAGPKNKEILVPLRYTVVEIPFGDDAAEQADDRHGMKGRLPFFATGAQKEDDGAFKHIEIPRRLKWIFGDEGPRTEYSSAALAAGEIFFKCYYKVDASSIPRIHQGLESFKIVDFNGAELKKARKEGVSDRDFPEPTANAELAKYDCFLYRVDYRTGHYRVPGEVLRSTALPMLFIHLAALRRDLAPNPDTLTPAAQAEQVREVAERYVRFGKNSDIAVNTRSYAPPSGDAGSFIVSNPENLFEFSRTWFGGEEKEVAPVFARVKEILTAFGGLTPFREAVFDTRYTSLFQGPFHWSDREAVIDFKIEEEARVDTKFEEAEVEARARAGGPTAPRRAAAAPAGARAAGAAGSSAAGGVRAGSQSPPAAPRGARGSSRRGGIVDGDSSDGDDWLGGGFAAYDPHPGVDFLAPHAGHNLQWPYAPALPKAPPVLRTFGGDFAAGLDNGMPGDGAGGQPQVPYPVAVGAYPPLAVGMPNMPAGGPGLLHGESQFPAQDHPRAFWPGAYDRLPAGRGTDMPPMPARGRAGPLSDAVQSPRKP